MEIVSLPKTAINLLADIDRSEQVDYAYRYVDGELERYLVDWSVAWEADGTGPDSVSGVIEFLRPILEEGGVLLGAFDHDDVEGLAVVVPEFELATAWLALLHVTRRSRRRGVGRALWKAAEKAAIAAGASSMYVSSIRSGPTVDFYLGQGCRLAKDPHPELYEREPDDIHLVREFWGWSQPQ